MVGLILLDVFVVAVLISFNALYVAGEFSAVSARKTRIIQMAEDGNRLAKMILPVLQDSHKLDNYIAASQVGITISSIVLGIYGEQQIAPLIEPLLERIPGLSTAAAIGISVTLVLLLLTTLQVVFGELLPKSIGLMYPERLALATAIPMKWSADYILKPLIVLLNGSGRLILRLLGIKSEGGHAHVHSPEEIVILVSESHQGGLIDAEERRLLRNVFRVSEMTAVEIAIPRTQMITVEVNEPVEEVLRRVADSAYTRIPVYENDVDHIIGFVHLRDLFSLYRRDPQGSLRDVMRPIPFIPETVHLIEVWNTLDEEQSYLAIVFDEYGGTSGMITWEDVIEELLGELQDEFDQERELIRPAGDGRLIVRGDMHVERINDMLDIDLPHHISHTVGGLILDELGRVPEVGDVVTVNGVKLTVEAVANNSVNSVNLVLPDDRELPPVEEAI